MRCEPPVPDACDLEEEQGCMAFWAMVISSIMWSAQASKPPYVSRWQSISLAICNASCASRSPKLMWRVVAAGDATQPHFIEVTISDVDDQVSLTIDKQTEKWEAMDHEQHVWNAIEEQQKEAQEKTKGEDEKERLGEKRKKQDKEELQGKRKHARSEFIQGATREELQSRDSPSMTHGQKVTISPLVGSSVANTWSYNIKNILVS
ncbi:hypothetical protein D1007_47407 [Hordeum vulgare]|nr:hypothetical protein D1007_47407 [Hordeum vulgare]